MTAVCFRAASKPSPSSLINLRSNWMHRPTQRLQHGGGKFYSWNRDIDSGFPDTTDHTAQDSDFSDDYGVFVLPTIASGQSTEQNQSSILGAVYTPPSHRSSSSGQFDDVDASSDWLFQSEVSLTSKPANVGAHQKVDLAQGHHKLVDRISNRLSETCKYSKRQTSTERPAAAEERPLMEETQFLVPVANPWITDENQTISFTRQQNIEVRPEEVPVITASQSLIGAAREGQDESSQLNPNHNYEESEATLDKTTDNIMKKWTKGILEAKRVHCVSTSKIVELTDESTSDNDSVLQQGQFEENTVTPEERGATLNEPFGGSATKLKKIGPKGTEVKLDGLRLKFPRNTVKDETEFEFSFDNDQQNYPTKGMAITPILVVKPSMNFDRPVSLKMRTWYSAARGKELTARIMYKEEDDDEWKLEQEVVLTDKNEINFDVWHFSGRIATISEGSNVDGVVHLFNIVYIHKGTGLLTSVFCKEEKALNEVESYFAEHRSVLAPPLEIRGKRHSSLQVKCIQPKDVTYVGRPTAIKFSKTLTCKTVSFYLRPADFPHQYKGPFMADYSVQIPDGTDDEFYGTLCSSWPVSSKAGEGDIKVDIHKTSKTINAVKVADGSSTFTTTEDGTINTIGVQTLLNDDTSNSENL